MDDWSEMVLGQMAKRSDIVVMAITLFFAMCGGLLAVFLGGQSIWGMWIPLCFITIPPIHYLCREVLRLRGRIEDLEKRSADHGDGKAE